MVKSGTRACGQPQRKVSHFSRCGWIYPVPTTSADRAWLLRVPKLQAGQPRRGASLHNEVTRTMSTVHIYPPEAETKTSSPLPQLLQTPSGLALLELQGTINLPAQTDPEDDSAPPSSLPEGIDVGRLEFPDYDPGAEGSAWMQRVHLYVGQHQRLTGEVKKLPRPLAVVRKRGGGEMQNDGTEDLEVAEVVKYKILFSNRPEPVGTAVAS